MENPDFNLLVTLEAVLKEGSVARAAARLRLSPSAMSRALARLRKAMGDPLLVRAGRGLVPTPRALELREEAGRIVEDAQRVLRPARTFNLERLVRTFTIRSREGFVDNFGPGLVKRVQKEAPGVRLCFLLKPDKESESLRDGTVDMETGVVEMTTRPEVNAQALFKDRYVGVVRKGHPLGKGKVTAARYASGRHVCVSLQGMERGPFDDAIGTLGLANDNAAIVGGFASALALARATDLIANVPERHTGNLRAGMHTFPLPFPLPGFSVSLLWHPRLDADPAHRWLRGCVREACT